MKKDVHPKYYSNSIVTCACGHTFITGSTKKSLQVDICSQCHPFFTGQMKFIDIQGKVEKFQAKQAKAKNYVKKNKKGKGKSGPIVHKSLKELMQEAKGKTKTTK